MGNDGYFLFDMFPKSTQCCFCWEAKSDNEIAVVSIGAVKMDKKENCERSDKIILETWNASRTKMDRIQICNNKVSFKKPGRWVTASKICLKLYSDNVNMRKKRIAEFAGGRMLKSEYKAQKKGILGRGKTMLPSSLMGVRALRNECSVLDNFLTNDQLHMNKGDYQPTSTAPTTTTTTTTTTTSTTTPEEKLAKCLSKKKWKAKFPKKKYPSHCK